MLACNIRANPRFIGLSFPGSMSPLPVISQYADDTSLVVTSDDSITATFDTYSLFEKGSGAKLNQSKSKGLWLGSWVGRTNPPVVLDWSPSKLKILGVYLGRGDLEEANWRPRIDALENVLLSWRQRSLSFQGRSLVINVLALARIWYVASLIHMPLWVLKELNSLVFNFFWRGKRELVARSSVVQPPLFGGFAVIDVKLKVQSLVVQWIKRFASSPACWTSFYGVLVSFSPQSISFGSFVLPLECFCALFTLVLSVPDPGLAGGGWFLFRRSVFPCYGLWPFLRYCFRYVCQVLLRVFAV